MIERKQVANNLKNFNETLVEGQNTQNFDLVETRIHAIGIGSRESITNHEFVLFKVSASRPSLLRSPPLGRLDQLL